MKYLIMIYGNDELWASFPEAEMAEGIAAQDAWNTKYFATGELLLAQGLGGGQSARVIQVRDGKTEVTDGPYLETKEYLGSLYIVDVPDEDRALELAAEMPFASVRSVEMWPVLHEGVPAE